MRRRIVAAAVGIAALSATLAVAAPGDLSLVSLSGGGTQGNEPADASAASADGRFVAFTSAANLVGVPTPAVELYVRDRMKGTTRLASANAAGEPANAAVDVQDVDNVQFAISGNGRYVVFASAATNLVAGGDATKDVYRKDLQTGAVTLVSVNTAGQKANAAVFGDPDVSYDGRAISFGSGDATNLFAGDLNNASDIIVRDIVAGTTVLAAQSAAGVLANATTERSAISANGHVVAFEAPTGTFNLLPGDVLNQGNDIVVRNLAAGTTAGASDPTAATGSSFPDISGDGRYVVFDTGFAYDATNDAFGGNDVYRRDIATGAIALASARNGLATGGDANSVRPAISADGSRVAFHSLSTNLAGADANAANDVYVRDPASLVTRRASVRADGTTASNIASERSAIAGNGGLVSFVHTDVGETTKLVAADGNNQPDVIAKEFAPTDTTPPALAISGATWTATDPSGIGEVTISSAPVAVAANGTFAVPAALGAVVVQAVDGAGNATSLTRPALPVTTPPTQPRVQRLKASLKGRRITVRFLLSADARVTVTLLRRTVRHKPKRRVVLTRVRRPLTKALKAGQRSVVLTLAKRPRAGRYVIRVRANASGLVSTATTTLVVKPLKPKRR